MTRKIGHVRFLHAAVFLYVYTQAGRKAKTLSSRVFLPGSEGDRLLATKVHRVEVASHLPVVVAPVFGVTVSQLARVVLSEALHFALVQKRAPTQIKCSILGEQH